MTLSYSDLLATLKTRASRAHASLLAPRSLTLRHWLERHLGHDAGSADALLGHPVFEHKFGFSTVDRTLEELSKQGLVHPRLVEQMDRPAAFPDERFPRDRHPYTHQVTAWQAVNDGRSVIVSAGTGSGKTECFVVPILSDLVGQALSRHAPLEGVQALFLYPLNALINSQRERLSAWTRGLDGKVRYCLYNGQTPRDVKANEERTEPERVLSRKRLRERPPPLLITNATMLEYMLVRPEDAPILSASKGKLKYIVIDEAHTYVGSMAAELALLLRRVMNAFEVDPKDVRFIATSATLSTDDQASGREDVRRFLADLSGQPHSNVEVVTDTRHIPALPDVAISDGVPDLPALEALPADEDRFDRLVRARAPRLLRDALVARNGRTLPDLVDLLDQDGLTMSPLEVLRLLDLGIRATDPSGDHFLPLRGHFFARGLAGLWACANPSCDERPSPDGGGDWAYGRVYTGRRETCGTCGARVYEIALCTLCGHDHLVAHLTSDENGDELFTPCDFEAPDVPVDETEDAEPQDDEPALVAAVDIGTAAKVFFALTSDDGNDAFDVHSGALGDGAHEVVFVEPGQVPHCLRCGYAGRAERPFARPGRTGRTFVLGVTIPVLLEAMPPTRLKSTLPFDGRRTISFTDSRQGTARFAARTQGEAERNFVRSFVYHELLASLPTPEAEAKARTELANMEAEVAALPDPSKFPAVVRNLEEKRLQVHEALTRPAQPLRHVAQRLAETHEFRALKKHWDLYLPFQLHQIDVSELAFWLVLREFARRPMRRASLETMGLVAVTYDGLDTRRAPPLEWTKRAGPDAQAAWADFLKLCVDFYIRSNTAIALNDANEFFRWVGSSITKKVIGGPGSTSERNVRVTWPRAKTNSRLEGLLRRALGLHDDDTETNHLIDEIFVTAWTRIQTDKLMRPEANHGYALKPEAMRLTLVREAWLCPITRTLLDTTLLGHSPYAPGKGFHVADPCKKVLMPRAPHAFGHRHHPAGRVGVRAWLETDETVRTARAEGALSEFAERILEFTEYFQTAEHSAQIPPSALRSAEQAFKAGTLNLLSCSTTMEMGVDIGNLSGVAMNNAPPSPANFLQRVGRAGRRGEAAAVSLTTCRHMPHDQGVFESPDWPFRTPMHVTPVRLDSGPIVRRHVRAAALTRFLLAQAQGDAIYRLTCAWFFVPLDGDSEAIVTRLIAWLQRPETAELLRDDLARLVHETLLDGTPPEVLLQQAVAPFEAVAERFDAVRKALEAERAALPEREQDDSPAAYAIRRQLARIDHEYLLTYLADEQILPGYGFPSGVLPFVHTTLEELRALKESEKRAKRNEPGDDARDLEADRVRIDARNRLAGVASRDLPMAIREYAPGSTIVLDRRAYTSRGVRLAWQLPPSATESDLQGIQALRRAWRCPDCGTAGTTHSEPMARCPSCGASLGRQVHFLLPTGFATDLFEPAAIDATSGVYVPVLRPWISSGSGALRGLGRPTVVRWRHSPSGEIVHLSAGANGHGYALCLRCGRAEPETEADATSLPSAMKDHRRLRGGKGSDFQSKNPGAACEGNDASGFAIKRNLRLGGSLRTDVLELHFRDPSTLQLVNDVDLLTTLAVALRKVAARALGVDARELGYEVSSRRAQGHAFHAVVLYDTASGGAGFVAQIPDLLPTLLRAVVHTCQACPRDCDRVCHGCLLSHDTQYDIEHLDRRAVVDSAQQDHILGAIFFAALDLPEAMKVFGDETTLVWTDPVEQLVALARRALREGPTVVTFFVAADTACWDPVAWAGRRVLRRLTALGPNLSVVLAIPDGALASLDWQSTAQLSGLAAMEGLRLVEIAAPATDGALPRWAEVTRGPQTTAWATTAAPPTLDPDWPTDDTDALHVCGPASPHPILRAVDPGTLTRLPPARVTALDISRATAGPCTKIGRRLLDTFDAASPGFLDELNQRGVADRVELHDRYLRSPAVVQVAYDLLQTLKDRGVIGPSTQLMLVTMEAQGRRPPMRVTDDWQVANDQRDVIEMLLRAIHPSATVRVVHHRDRLKTQHHRSLELSWGATEIELRFDEGFGFVEVDRPGRFPFGRPATEQASALLAAAWLLRRRGGYLECPAYLVRG